MARKSRTMPRSRPAVARSAPSPSLDTLYIPVERAAQIAGVTRSFLEREINQGRLPGIRDISLKVHRADLEAWRGQPVATAAATPRRVARAGAATSAA